MWFAREDGRQILVQDISSSTPVNWWNPSGVDLILRGGEQNGSWRIQELGKIWLTAFMTGKLFTQVHDTIRRYDSQLIVAREFIPDRIDIVDWAPAPGTFNEITNGNTMQDEGSSPPGQNQITVLDNWNSAIYAKDVGPYGAYINMGSGHTNSHDAVYAQILSALESACDWKQIFPLSDASAFTENNEAGSNPEGGIPPGVESSPVPPHNYDELVYIPAAAYGNQKGAACYVQLSAIGSFPELDGPRRWTWFLNLDNAGTVNPCVWAKGPAGPSGNVSAASENSAVFDPVGNCVWMIGKGPRTHIGKLAKVGGVWGWTEMVHGVGGAYNTGQGLAGGYCPALDCIVWFDPQTSVLIIWKPSADRSTGTMYYDVPTTGTEPTRQVGMEWCPHPSVQKFYGMELHRGAGSLAYGTITISNASPAVVTLTGGQTLPPEGVKIFLDTNDTLPSPLSIGGGGYFVRNPSGSSFNLSSTQTGALINTTTPGAGSHRAFYAYAIGHQLRTLTPPATLLGGGGTPNSWTWGSETLTPAGGATIGNDSINERYNALRWVWAAKSFAWSTRLNGKTNFLRPAGAT